VLNYESSTGGSHFQFQGTVPAFYGSDQVKPRKEHSRELPIWVMFEKSTYRVRAYSYRNSNVLCASTCRDNSSDKLKCSVSWHCMLDIPGLPVSSVTQGHHGEWVSLCYPFFQFVSKLLWKSPVASCAQLIKTLHCIQLRSVIYTWNVCCLYYEPEHYHR
jgi:hypothetical protein